MKIINPTQTAAWQALQKHFDEMKDVTIAELFAKDSDRFSKFSATFDDLMLIDFSKNRITQDTLAKITGSGERDRPGRRHQIHVLRRENQPHRRSRGTARGPA